MDRRIVARIKSKRRATGMKQVRGFLLLHGLTLQEFCSEYRFNRYSVISAVERHWGRPTEPVGETTKKILSTLKGLETEAYKALHHASGSGA